jgi:hypothetical protein
MPLSTLPVGALKDRNSLQAMHALSFAQVVLPHHLPVQRIPRPHAVSVRARNLDQLLAEEDVHIKPAVNQIEFHPWNQQREIRKWCKDNGIVVVAY